MTAQTTNAAATGQEDEAPHTTRRTNTQDIDLRRWAMEMASVTVEGTDPRKYIDAATKFEAYIRNGRTEGE